MKKAAPWIMVGLTIAFAVFLLGFFVGRNFTNPGITMIVVETQPSVTNTTIPESQKSTTAPAEEITEPALGNWKININNATLDELVILPGVGPVLAQRIIDYRVENGAFQTIEDLTNVSGIGEKTYQQLADFITVEE